MNTAINRVMDGVYVRPTGSIAWLIALAGLILARFELAPPEWIATAIIVVPIFLISRFAPRWAETRGLLYNHPAAFAAFVAVLIAYGLRWIFGVELTGDEFMMLAGGVSGLVSLFTPIEEPEVLPTIEGNEAGHTKVGEHPADDPPFESSRRPRRE